MTIMTRIKITVIAFMIAAAIETAEAGQNIWEMQRQQQQYMQANQANFNAMVMQQQLIQLQQMQREQQMQHNYQHQIPAQQQDLSKPYVFKDHFK